MVDPTLLSFGAGVGIAVVSGIVMILINRKLKKKDENDTLDKADKETLEEIQKSIWRLNKTVLIMAKIIDDQNVKVHSELSSSLEDIASELLREPHKE